MRVTYIIIVSVFIFSSVSGQINFDIADRVETGNQPTLLKKAYLNNDSIEDIIYLNKGDNLIAYRYGIDNLSFESENHLVAVGEAKDYVIADFNNDDIPDIAITLYDKDSTALYLSAEGDIFSFRKNLFGGIGPFGISARDLNNDSNVDLVISYFDEDSLGYYTGNGEGSFTELTKLKTLAEPSHVEILPDHDLNQFNIALAQSDSVSLYYANSDDLLFIRYIDEQIQSPINLITHDLDDNGYFDIVTLTLDRRIKTYRFESSNNYIEQVSTTLNNPISIDQLDLDNSNRFIVGSDRSYFSILEIKNNDYLFSQNYLTEVPISSAISVGDDSSYSVLVTNHESNSLEMFLSDSEDGLRGIQILPYGTDSKVIVSDLNGDNFGDLIYTRSNAVHVLYRYDSTKFSTEFSYMTGEGAWDVASTDVDNDGYNDLIVVNSYEETFSVLLNNGDSTFQTSINYSVSGEPRGIIANDYDGDGLDDIVISNYTGSEVLLYLNHGNGVFILEENYSIGSPENLYTIDLNGDGKLDHVIYSATEDTRIIYSSSDKYFDRHEDLTCFYTPLYSLDLNEDGVLDLVGFDNLGESKLAVYQSNNTGRECLLFDLPIQAGGNVASLNLNGSPYNDLIYYDTDSLISLTGASHTSFVDKQSFRIGSQRDKFNHTAINLDFDTLTDLIISNKQEIMLLRNSSSPEVLLSFSIENFENQLTVNDTVETNQPYNKEILILNNGNKVAENVMVEVLGDNFSISQVNSSIAPYTEERINLEFISDKEGDFVGELTISESGQQVASLDFHINVTKVVTGTNEYKQSRLIYFPNPTPNVITIDGITGRLEVKLIDSKGRVKISSNSKNIDISHLKAGFYILRVFNENKVYTKTIIKK